MRLSAWFPFRLGWCCSTGAASKCSWLEGCRKPGWQVWGGWGADGQVEKVKAEAGKTLQSMWKEAFRFCWWRSMGIILNTGCAGAIMCRLTGSRNSKAQSCDSGAEMLPFSQPISPRGASIHQLSSGPLRLRFDWLLLTGTNGRKAAHRCVIQIL